MNIEFIGMADDVSDTGSVVPTTPSLKLLRQKPEQVGYVIRAALRDKGYCVIREDDSSTSTFFLESVFAEWASRTFELPYAAKSLARVRSMVPEGAQTVGEPWRRSR